VVVLYGGSRMEEAATVDLFERPRHPYTLGLLASKPRLTPGIKNRPGRLAEIPGTVPSPTDLVGGCAFAPRCSRALPRCAELRPRITGEGGGHLFSCWNPASPEGGRP
jgi:peptide/nickel transport system ATP-binding protein